MALTLIEVDKRTAVIEVRVEENYKMLEPMWQDWLAEKQRAENEQIERQQASDQGATEAQMVQEAKAKYQLQEAPWFFGTRTLR